MNTHENPCTETRTHFGLRQQCSLGKGHSRPHTFPAVGESEYAALYRAVEALAGEWERHSRGLLCLSGVESDRLFRCALELRRLLRPGGDDAKCRCGHTHAKGDPVCDEWGPGYDESTGEDRGGCACTSYEPVWRRRRE